MDLGRAALGNLQLNLLSSRREEATKGGKGMKPKKDALKNRLSDAQNLSNRQRMEKLSLAPHFRPAGHPPTSYLSP